MPQIRHRARLLELASVGDALSDVLQPEDANLWIFSPNPQLDHDTPARWLRDGEYRRVLALIDVRADAGGT